MWKERVLADPGEAFLRELTKPLFLVTLALLMLLSNVVGHLWFFEYPGLKSLDVFAASSLAKPAAYAQIVTVDSKDYQNYFGGISPLNGDKLGCAIRKIFELGPAVVVVDFDTLSTQVPRHEAFGERAVWARGATVGEDGRLDPLPILDNRLEDPPMWGLALVPEDRDGTIREFARYIESSDGRWLPSLHWAAAEAFCRVTSAACQYLPTNGKSGDKSTLDPAVFHRRYTFQTLRLRNFVAPSSDRSQACMGVWGSKKAPDDNPLRGKLVFLGGSYALSDRQPTPFGMMNGVEIAANAVEAEFDPAKPGLISVLVRLSVEILLAVIVAAVHHYLQPRYALVATMLVLVAAIFFGSFVVFYVGSYRASFAPLVVGIWIEQLFESAERAHKLERRSLGTGVH